MKNRSKTLIGALALAVSVWSATAQEKPDGPPPGGQGRPGQQGGGQPRDGQQGGRPLGGGPGGEGQRPPVPPLIAALDSNGDGVIDEVEINQASASLRKLDKNGDGKLTADEIRPPRPPGGQRGPGGQGGPGGPGGPGSPDGQGKSQRTRPPGE